jgi:hypothetical protein
VSLLRTLLIATAALAFGFATPAQATAANVVPNPGFEQGGCSDTPVICGWVGQSGFMFQGSAHTGQFGMGLGCWQTGCWPSGGWASVGAATDLSACAAIGPGAHPASFWFSGSVEWAALNAAFYQGSDCTGFLGGDMLGDSSGGQGWQQLTGPLLAPAGTQSVQFFLGGAAQCEDFCVMDVAFDDLDVEDTLASDTTPPETTITSGPSGTTNTNSATFEFEADEPATFKCGLDSAPLQVCSSPVSYSDLSDGPHTFRVRATDSTGNVDPTPAERTWTVETTPPQTTITSGRSGTTREMWAQFAFIASEPSTFECSLDDAQFAACYSPTGYDGLGEGAHTFRVRAVDGSGNPDPTPAEQSWTVDRTPPETTITSGPLRDDGGDLGDIRIQCQRALGLFVQPR